MSIAIGDYTDTDQIRGALGFTLSDVPDDYIKNRGIEDDLLISLYDWIPDHKALYSAWTLGGTDQDKHYKRLLEKYCRYTCAFHLCSGIELLAIQTIGDSKVVSERFAKASLETLRQRAESVSLGVREDLIAELSLTTAAITAGIFSKVPPTFDPVVGS